MKDTLISSLQTVMSDLGVKNSTIKLEYPEDATHGDYATNIAMMYAKLLGMSPRSLAEKVVNGMNSKSISDLQKIEIAGPGFINFKIEDKYFADTIVKSSGSSSLFKKDNKKKVMVEYTDPNPFKIFHIGHLMANAVGESLSRLVESSGTEVVRACYQGDVGLHVAKTIWGVKYLYKKDFDALVDSDKSVVEKVKFLGTAYVSGSNAYEKDDVVKQVTDINIKIFDKTDGEINKIYDLGRKWSLEYFDTIYARLGTKFDTFFFESEVASDGVKIVKDFLQKGVFEQSDGAIVFKGEKYGTHTRVFLNSQGLPTYEAKEIGLNIKKFQNYPDLDQSVIVTANEQSDYFKVLLSAFAVIDKNVAEKTKHISHGVLRFSSGKMSSRKGNIISAEELLTDIRAMVLEKIKDRDFPESEKDELADTIAIGAIKYTILRQSIGSDIIFDSSASISFEGDSGPYLQYSAVRAGAIIKKAQEQGIVGAKNNILTKIFGGNVKEIPESVTHFEKILTRFADVSERARVEYAPQIVANYLTLLAGEFNSFYAKQVIVDKNDKLSPYYVAVTKLFLETMKEGLWLLGIKVPNRM